MKARASHPLDTVDVHVYDAQEAASQQRQRQQRSQSKAERVLGFSSIPTAGIPSSRRPWDRSGSRLRSNLHTNVKDFRHASSRVSPAREAANSNPPHTSVRNLSRTPTFPAVHSDSSPSVNSPVFERTTSASSSTVPSIYNSPVAASSPRLRTVKTTAENGGTRSPNRLQKQLPRHLDLPRASASPVTASPASRSQSQIRLRDDVKTGASTPQPGSRGSWHDLPALEQTVLSPRSAAIAKHQATPRASRHRKNESSASSLSEKTIRARWRNRLSIGSSLRQRDGTVIDGPATVAPETPLLPADAPLRRRLPKLGRQVQDWLDRAELDRHPSMIGSPADVPSPWASEGPGLPVATPTSSSASVHTLHSQHESRFASEAGNRPRLASRNQSGSLSPRSMSTQAGRIYESNLQLDSVLSLSSESSSEDGGQPPREELQSCSSPGLSIWSPANGGLPPYTMIPAGTKSTSTLVSNLTTTTAPNTRRTAADRPPSSIVSACTSEMPSQPARASTLKIQQPGPPRLQTLSQRAEEVFNTRPVRPLFAAPEWPESETTTAGRRFDSAAQCAPLTPNKAKRTASSPTPRTTGSTTTTMNRYVPAFRQVAGAGPGAFSPSSNRAYSPAGISSAGSTMSDGSMLSHEIDEPATPRARPEDSPGTALTTDEAAAVGPVGIDAHSFPAPPGALDSARLSAQLRSGLLLPCQPGRKSILQRSGATSPLPTVDAIRASAMLMPPSVISRRGSAASTSSSSRSVSETSMSSTGDLPLQSTTTTLSFSRSGSSLSKRGATMGLSTSKAETLCSSGNDKMNVCGTREIPRTVRAPPPPPPIPAEDSVYAAQGGLLGSYNTVSSHSKSTLNSYVDSLNKSHEVSEAQAQVQVQTQKQAQTQAQSLMRKRTISNVPIYVTGLDSRSSNVPLEDEVAMFVFSDM